MTGSKVLIVKLPELHADVKMLEAFRAYVCDALGAGALVLPLARPTRSRSSPRSARWRWSRGTPCLS